MTEPEARAITEVVVALDDPDAPDPARELGDEVARRLGVAVRSVHVEAGPEIDHDEVSDAIAARLEPTSLLVVRSQHASRWSGKRSVAEHLVDRWGGLVLSLGPEGQWTSRAGPVVVAVNGSAGAERAVSPAGRLAAAFGVGLALAWVVAEDEGAGSEAGTTAERAESYLDSLAAEIAGGRATACVLRSNDHVGALAAEAERRSSPFIALASIGDRTVRRPTISRTSSGLMHEAGCPVLVVGHEWL